MNLTVTKIYSLFLSILLHITLFYCLYSLHTYSQEDSKWSGGYGDGQQSIIYVSLDDSKQETGLKEMITNDSKSDTSVKSKTKIFKKQPKTKRNISKISSKKPLNDRSKKAGKQLKNFGIGRSDTPGGGIGPGLDPDGKILNFPPNILASIRKKIMRKKSYPNIAKENKWIGHVKLSFKINESGGLDFVKIVKSSGYNALDQSAVKTIHKAVPLPFYPKEIALSIEYKLE